MHNIQKSLSTCYLAWFKKKKQFCSLLHYWNCNIKKGVDVFVHKGWIKRSRNLNVVISSAKVFSHDMLLATSLTNTEKKHSIEMGGVVLNTRKFTGQGKGRDGSDTYAACMLFALSVRVARISSRDANSLSNLRKLGFNRSLGSL